MDDLERRLLVLEMQTRHDREMINWRLSDLSRQLQELQTSRPLAQISAGSVFKILIALLLPIGVLVVTGDPRKAMEASRLVTGH